MRKFYFDELYGDFPTDTFAKIDKMFDEMFKPAIDNMKCGNQKIVVVDSLSNLAEVLEKDAIKTHKEQEKHKCECGEECKKASHICLDIQSILANHEKNAFTVVWEDGTHTMIHLQPGDTWDNEKALAMCYVKHIMGDTGSFNDIFTQELPEKLKEIFKKEESEKDIPEGETTATGGTIGGFSATKPAIKKLAETCKKAGIDLKRAGETANESAKATITLNDSLTEMLTKFLSSSVPVYDVYVRGRDKNTKIVASAEKNVISKYLNRYIQKNYPTIVGTPQRIWTVGNEMYIDFGASEYFIIPGMTCEEWNKNN